MASSESTLPWLWVIEALASFKQVDTSILSNLVKGTPEIADDLGKNARELVSFRILEKFVAKRVTINGNVSSGPISGSEFDPSEHCENVVSHMLRVMSASGERTYEAEILKAQVQNFITRKKDFLPKCTLQKLKDAIIEGNHPALASLKERSGLSTSDQSEERILMNDVDLNETTGFVDVQKLTSQNMEKLLDPSEEDFRGRNSTPSKRAMSYSEAEDQAFRIPNPSPSLDPESTHDLQIPKKAKQDVGSKSAPDVRDEQAEALVDELHLDLRVNGGELYAEPGTLNAEPPNGTSQNICGEANDKFEKPQTGVHNGGELCAELGTLIAEPPNGTSQNFVGEANDKFEKPQTGVHNGVPHARSRSNNFSHGAQPEVDHTPTRDRSIDNDDDQDENVDVDMKKRIFMSSQCSFSQDSLATVDCTELNICMKCGNGGELLVCSASSCPIVVHQRCLGSVPSFDNSGKFFCPFCSYSRAISVYTKAKKKAALAREDIAIFLELKNTHRSEETLKNFTRREQNQRRQDVGANGHDQAKFKENHMNDTCNCQNRENTSDKLQAPSTSCVDGDLPIEIEGSISEKGNREGGTVGSDCQPTRALGHHTKRQACRSLGNKNTSSKETETTSVIEKHGEGTKDIQFQQQLTDSPKQAKFKENHVNYTSNCQNRKNARDKLQAPSTSCVDGDRPIEIEGSVLGKGSREGGMVGSDCQPSTALERQHIKGQACRSLGNKNTFSNETETASVIEKHGGGIEGRRFQQRLTDLPKQAACQANLDAEESSGEEDDQTTFDFIISYRKLENNNTYPAIPQLRRKKVPWTSEEEEALKEGVLRLRSDHDNVIQWKKILELGSHVFQKGRTAVDLKDKWRNICKGSPKPKG